jgi:hypothetical protein
MGTPKRPRRVENVIADLGLLDERRKRSFGAGIIESDIELAIGLDRASNEIDDILLIVLASRHVER